MYKCTDYYHPESEGGVIYNDPDIGIKWPVKDPILVDRDRKFPRLKDLTPDELPRTES